MTKKSRTREMPLYVSGDFIITETVEIDRELVTQIDTKKSCFVVDTPECEYLERIAKWFEKEFPSMHITKLDDEVIEKEEEKRKSDQKVEDYNSDKRVEKIEDHNNNGKMRENIPISPSIPTPTPTPSSTPTPSPSFPLLCTLKRYKRMKKMLRELEVVFVFVNIRKLEDKKKLVEECKKYKESFFFLSNIYRIENMSEIEKLSFNRILPKKEGFGLARSVKSFGRTHEVIFCGESHLKTNGFIIAMDKNITVPCIIAVEKTETKEEVKNTLNRIPLLLNKYTEKEEEYLQKKKWIFITTYENILHLVAKNSFPSLRNITNSIVSYDSIDKVTHLLSMHQVSLNVFSLCTTQDRGKVKNIVRTLPEYGINLGDNAQDINIL